MFQTGTSLDESDTLTLPAPAVRVAATRSAPRPPDSHLRPGSINIDMDTLADYARGYAFAYREKPDPVYAVGLPRFLDVLAEEGVRATIFVIARDARIPQHAEVLRRAVDEGHELANHTLTHPRNLASLPESELRREIEEAHEVISALRGSPCVGFRAPCYDVSNQTLALLRELGYLYDSSVHPIALAPAIDLAVLIKSRLRIREFRTGTYMHLLAPVVPYIPAETCYWLRGHGGTGETNGQTGFLELPLSTVPRTRMPFYGSFIQATGMKRFHKSLQRHARSERPLNFHFHGVELVEMQDEGVDPRFSVHPGLAKPAVEKESDVREMVRSFQKHYDLMPLEDLARQAQTRLK